MLTKHHSSFSFFKCSGSYSNPEDHHGQRSQGYEMIGRETGNESVYTFAIAYFFCMVSLALDFVRGKKGLHNQIGLHKETRTAFLN